ARRTPPTPRTRSAAARTRRVFTQRILTGFVGASGSPCPEAPVQARRRRTPSSTMPATSATPAGPTGVEPPVAASWAPTAAGGPPPFGCGDLAALAAATAAGCAAAVAPWVRNGHTPLVMCRL